MTVALIVSLMTLMFLAIACQGKTDAGVAPADTLTLQPTYTPLPTLEPLPTYTPYPTYTMYPTTTATRIPTSTPKPSPMQTGEWSGTGEWYRDPLFEDALTKHFQKQGFSHTAAAALLNADPQGWSSDLFLGLVCVGSFKAVYIWSYNFVIPDGFDAYTIGIWDKVAGEWTDYTSARFTPIITDTGSAIYITNQAQVGQIIDIIKDTDRLENLPNLAMSAIIYDSMNTAGEHMGSEFNPAGWQDAALYLGCLTAAANGDSSV